MAHERDELTEEVGSLAGLGAGILTGAELGTALIPIPGVGTFTGAFLGGLLGSEVGKIMAMRAWQGLNTLADGLTQLAENISREAEATARETMLIEDEVIEGELITPEAPKVLSNKPDNKPE